jgi:aspartyl-tRNA(Asn)/glutamyl-tRNA(Gln) amidotransferase subunit A
MDPCHLTLSELALAYRQGQLRPSEVLEAYLKKMNVGSIYRIITEKRARAQARHAEQLFERQIDLGPLQGIPLAIKDLLDTKGEVTAAGSKILAEGQPALEDAPVVARLDAAGAIFLGKTTMTELAFSGLGINPHFGTPGCALDETRIPGGSSSGSAVAVAKTWACAALGSDTGGSVRIPAAFNGLVGLKTTNGSLPTDGTVALSTTLDTLGPITRTTEDAWHLWRAMSTMSYTPFDKQLPKALKFLVPSNIILEQADPEVVSAFTRTCQRLSKEGHQLSQQTVPELQTIRDLYARYGGFASHEALALYGDMLESRGADIDPRVARRILEFKDRSSSDYLRLSYARHKLVQAFWETYRPFDAILAPTVAILPPKLESLSSDEAYYQANGFCLRNTLLFNFLAGPALSVPCATTKEGLSVGLMIATAPLQEELALKLGALIEGLEL